MTSLGSMTTENREPKWCERCKCFHPWAPPWAETEAALVDRMTKEISDDIDEQVYQELLKKIE